MPLTIPADGRFFDWRRTHFPYFQRKICLTHASVSPLPAATAAAIADYATRMSTEGQFDFVHEPMYRRCKERLARLLGHGALTSEIAFAGSTSHALGMVATSLPWQPGDNVVVADGDFPANVVTWKNLAFTHGVEVRFIPARASMDITVADLEPLVDEKTRLVSLSAAHFLSGYSLDTKDIGAWLHTKNVLFCLDAIQMLGAIRFDISEADFVCADAHKWLLGPNGAAVLWVRSSVQPQLRPAILGWLSTTQREDWYAYGTTPRANADSFEPGARNYLGIVGFEASLALLEEVGGEVIEQRCVHLRDYAAKALKDAGCNLLWKTDPGVKSGIVSFNVPGVDTKALFKKLDESFALSLRANRAGEDWIRISAHFMNHEQDIDQLLDAIAAIRIAPGTG